MIFKVFFSFIIFLLKTNMRTTNKLQILDKYFGNLLIIIFLFFKPIITYLKSNLKNDFSRKKILIIQPTAIGDTIISSLLINKLFEKYNRKKIDVYVCVSKNNAPIIKLFNKNIKIKIINFSSLLSISQNISKHDLIIDLSPWSNITSLFSFLTFSKKIIGFRSKGYLRHLLFDQSVEFKLSGHVFNNYQDMGSLFCLNIKPQYPVFKKLSLPYKLHKLINQNYICINPYAGGSQAKQKELSNFIWKDVVSNLKKKNIKIVIIGNKKFPDEFLQKSDSVLNLSGLTSLLEVVALICNAKFILTVDTGVAHIASVYKIFNLVIYGPTSPKRWGTFSDTSFHLCSKQLHHGYMIYGNETKYKDSFNDIDITSKSIIGLAEKILKERGL